MEYFLVSQDKEYTNAPRVSNVFKMFADKNKEENDYYKVEENATFFLKKDDNIEFIDWIDAPILLISDKVKEILSFYNTSMQFKRVMLYDSKNYDGVFYYAPLLQKADCISEDSKWNFDKSGLVSIVIDEEKVPKNCVLFQLDKVRSRYIIARLDLVESMIRRGIEGCTFTKLQTK